MSEGLRVLILEDNPADAELMLKELGRGGLKAEGRRVETEAEFASGLTPEVGLVLADYNLPQYDGLRALRRVRATGLDIPVIIVSGSIGEELTVSMMLQGAAGVVLKARLQTLGTVAGRVLEEAAVRRENRETHTALKREVELRDAIESSMVSGLLVFDLSGRITHANPAISRMLGYSREGLVGLSVPLPIWPEEIREKMLEQFWGALKESKTFRNLDSVAQARDGRRIDVQLQLSPLRSADRTVGMLVLLHDATEQKRRERERERLTAVLATQQETALDGILIVDENRGIVSFNRRFLEIFRLTDDDLASRTDEAALKAAFKQLRHPDEFLKRVEYLYGHKEDKSREEILMADGRIVDRYSAPMYGPGGDYFGRVWYFRDITESRRAEEALKESEASLKRTQEMAHIGGWTVDIASGAVSLTEEARKMFQEILPSEPDLARYLERVHPDDLPAARRAWEAGLEIGKIQEECRLRHEGAEAWVRVVAEIEKDAQGRPVRAVGTAQDVTDRKRLESEVMQGEKMRSIGVLAGGVAHDFNNLLMVVMANCDFLLESLDLNDPRRADLEEIRAAGEKGAALTRQLLIFSRREVSQRSVFDLNEVIRNLAKMLGRLIGEDVKAEMRLCAEAALMEGDPGQLEQAVVNLAVNARDAMAAGGRLTVSTERPNGKVVLRVEDTGCGMTPEVKARLFEPFFTTKPAGKGTGLGLSTVYGIVRGNGGAIAVQSEPGQGTRFTMTFAAAAACPAGAAPPEEEASLAEGHETILLVEDDAAVRRLDIRALEQLGYRVLPVRSAEEALETFARDEAAVDLVVSDVVLPGQSGADLAKALVKRRPGLPVIFVTGFVGHQALEALRQMPHEVLQKPVSPGALGAKVRAALDAAKKAAAARS